MESNKADTVELPSYARLIGEFTGTLKGILTYELADDVRQRISDKVKELEAISIEEITKKDYPFIHQEEELKEDEQLYRFVKAKDIPTPIPKDWIIVGGWGAMEPITRNPSGKEQ